MYFILQLADLESNIFFIKNYHTDKWKEVNIFLLGERNNPAVEEIRSEDADEAGKKTRHYFIYLTANKIFPNITTIQSYI